MIFYHFAILSIFFLFQKFVLTTNFPKIPRDLSTPIHQRISLKNSGSIAIGWDTYEGLIQPCVEYGLTSNYLNQKACSSSSITYPNSRTWKNTVILTYLKPATQYYYKIVSTNSSVIPFKTGRNAGDLTPFKVNTIIDLGVYGKDGYTIKSKHEKRMIPYITASADHTTISQLINTLDDFELIIHPGDLGYADDWFLHHLSEGEKAYEAILEQFYDQLSPVSGSKYYMVSPGNHEAACREIAYRPGACPQGQFNFTDFDKRFGQLMPTAFDSFSKSKKAKGLREIAKQLANPPFWFSFDYGMAHIVMFDTETDFNNAPDQIGGSANLFAGPFRSPNQQIKFLEADLASVDRSITPWLIVAGHRPWYSTNGQFHECKPCQDAFEDIFYKFGVDLAVFGHVHNSQRFDPVYKNVVDPAGYENPKAPMYIVAGGAGNIEGLDSIGNRQSFNAFGYDQDYSYASLSFQNKTHLQIDFIRSFDGSILDSSTLIKNHSIPFVIQ